MTELLRALRAGDEALTGLFDRAFAAHNNPWRHLGALAFLMLVLSVASGVIAYAIYDTSVEGAYASGRRLQMDPWLFGRLLRGVHRYAGDGFMLLTILHLLREALRGHYRGIRWFSWITGVPLLWLIWIAGITGLWLLWDERALYSANATAEWFQVLPLSSDQLTRNFLTPSALTDRFFSLVVFMHIGVPLLLLAGFWVHIQRVSHVRIWPPKSLSFNTSFVLAMLSLAIPAESLGPADTGRVSSELSLDWFYMALHPLVELLSASSVWWLSIALTALLVALPFLPIGRSSIGTSHASRAAVVNLANCNGCSRCVADCPFGAVIMVPRTDDLNHRQQAAVLNDMCAACGICVGSCPSSTPFRRIEDIVSGIELPQRSVAHLRQQLQRQVASLQGSGRIMVFACGQAAQWSDLSDSATGVMSLECAGMLPPSFIEYALRLGADGVVVSGCRESDCEFRLGDRWVRDRLNAAREPRLRAAAPRERIAVVWAGNQRHEVLRTISHLREKLCHADTPPKSSTIGTSDATMRESHDD